MSTTLTELHRNTAKVIGQVVHGQKTVTIQIHGKDAAKIMPLPGKVDRKKMVEDFCALEKFGPITLPER